MYVDAGKAPAKKEALCRVWWRLLVPILIATIYFAAYSRKVEERSFLDVHSGESQKTRRGYWGGITIAPGKPWRAADFKQVFPDKTEPRWMLLSVKEYTVLPELSRRARRRARGNDDNDYGGSTNSGFWTTVNLSQVLDAPHIDRETRQQIIYRSFDGTKDGEPVWNIHILDDLRQAVLDATDFPPEDRVRLQAEIDRDKTGDIMVFLREAASHPGRNSN